MFTMLDGEMNCTRQETLDIRSNESRIVAHRNIFFLIFPLPFTVKMSRWFAHDFKSKLTSKHFTFRCSITNDTMQSTKCMICMNYVSIQCNCAPNKQKYIKPPHEKCLVYLLEIIKFDSRVNEFMDMDIEKRNTNQIYRFSICWYLPIIFVEFWRSSGMPWGSFGTVDPSWEISLPY